MSVPTLITLSVRVSRDEHDRLRRLAEGEHRSLSGELRKAIEAHLESVDPIERSAA